MLFKILELFRRKAVSVHFLKGNHYDIYILHVISNNNNFLIRFLNKKSQDYLRLSFEN